MPLIYANPGEENIIKRIGGSSDIKRHLEDLGFTPGGTVTLISILNGNIIVKVKESRIALSEDMARRVFV
ncbi:MAG: ferrous iron transport protein A [Clostridiales bacterium]|nr:ferrous iron transport protein A [Clostridiales bacterium]